MQDLRALRPTDEAVFGGKACGLGRLLALDARVPAGFALPATLDPPGQWPASDREAFLSRAAPFLAAGPLAVRSSAPGEDGSARSFAGLFETVLGVCDEASLLAAVERCITSGSSERVRAYTGETGARPVGVVVQAQIDAQAAGVCFTVDPSGRDGAVEKPRVTISSVASSIPSDFDLLSREMRRLRASDYHRMIEAGIFDEDERVELLEGVIVSVSPQNAYHALVVERLSDPVFVSLPSQFVIRCQLPLTLSETDEPEPDVAVIDRTTPRSRQRQPGTARLIFEAAGDSLRKDREIKAAVYARAGVLEYVVVNLKEECLEVNRDPDPATGRYRTHTRLLKSERFSSEAVAGLAFPIAELLA